MSPRELVILILGLAIVAVILRGLYVAMRARRGQIRLAIEKEIPSDLSLEDLEMAELPNGGARIRTRGAESSDDGNGHSDDDAGLASASARAEVLELDDREDSSVPVLMDVVEIGEVRHPDSRAEPESPSRSESTAEPVASWSGDEPDLEELDSPAFPFTATGTDTDPEIASTTDTDTEADNGLAGLAPDYEQDREQPDSRWLGAGFEADSALGDTVGDRNSEADCSQELPESDQEAADEGVAEIEQEVWTSSTEDNAELGGHDEDPEARRDEEDIRFGTHGSMIDEQEGAPASESPHSAGEDYVDEVEESEAFWEEEDVAGRRREPSFDTQASFEDTLDDFPMSAGERIGAREGTKKSRPARQPSVAEDTGVGEVPDESAETGPGRTRSRFSIAAITGRLDKSRRAPEQERDEQEQPDPAIVEEQPETAVDAEEAPSLADSSPGSAAASRAKSRKDKTRAASSEAGSRRSRGGGEKVSPSEPATPAEPSEVLVLNVMARDGREILGDDLLEALITSGLKFGDMNIFHKRIGSQGKGPSIFSVANILNPGTFDLNTISEFSTVGVSLFMALPTPVNNLEAFELMISTARKLQADLDAELRDDHRNVLTAQTVEHYRQRIRDFELRQLKMVGSRA